MPSISAVIITYNEEKNIARCIESVLPVADEIVVVDSFSTDKTKQIALSYPNVKFVENAFAGHIEQKNFAITCATYPHILSLDADEALSPQLLESVINAKKNWEADGYSFNRLTNYCGKWIKHGGWYPDAKLRLWDSRKGKWGGTNPHDMFIMDKGSKIMHLKGDLLHYSFYTINQHVQQGNKFSDIRAEALYKKGKKANSFHLFIKPAWKFFHQLILKAGFMDGMYGWIIAINSAHVKFQVYSKLWHLNHKKD